MKRHTTLVTGASSGIGEALALALGARAAHIVLVARSVERLQALKRRIEDAGGSATVIGSDLAEPGAAQRLHEDVRRRSTWSPWLN